MMALGCVAYETSRVMCNSLGDLLEGHTLCEKKGSFLNSG